MALPIVTLDAGSRKAVELAEKFGERFGRALMPAAVDMAEAILTVVKEQQFRGDPLQTRTGMLVNSVTRRVVRVGDTIVAAIGVLRGPATAYARIQEQGGEVKAAPGKALAVPLDAAKTGTGRPRFPGGPREAARKYPGDVFLLKRKGKAPLIVRAIRVGGGGKKVKRLEPLFILLKSVKLPATYWLSEGVLKGLESGGVAFSSRLERELFAA